MDSGADAIWSSGELLAFSFDPSANSKGDVIDSVGVVCIDSVGIDAGESSEALSSADGSVIIVELG